MSKKHIWKPGDLFWHGLNLYMVITPSRSSTACLRLNDGGCPDGVVTLASSDWHETREAKFVCNMQHVFAELEHSRFGWEESHE